MFGKDTCPSNFQAGHLIQVSGVEHAWQRDVVGRARSGELNRQHKIFECLSIGPSAEIDQIRAPAAKLIHSCTNSAVSFSLNEWLGISKKYCRKLGSTSNPTLCPHSIDRLEDTAVVQLAEVVDRALLTETFVMMNIGIIFVPVLLKFRVTQSGIQKAIDYEFVCLPGERLVDAT